MGSSFDKLTELFGRFPGIGPRQAKRFVYFLLTQPSAFAVELAKELEQIKRDVAQCTECQRFFRGAGNHCHICESAARNNRQLLIVEKDVDLDAIEKSGVYKGLYFVLGGIIPILEAVPETKVRLQTLTALIKRRANSLEEIILALSATPDGDHTADVIREKLQSTIPAVPIHVLGRGLSTGSELEYADRETLRNAFEGRK
jgi:recombination protein RecR